MRSESWPPGAPVYRMSEVEFELLRRLVMERFGLDLLRHQRDRLGARLSKRLNALRLRTFSAYYRALRHGLVGPDEWDELADVATNSETYFFREKDQFVRLGRLVPQLVGAGRPLRVLSAGCSSGEEAYSLAILLMAHPSTHAGFEVRGVDVSLSRLAEAREGRYKDRSVRPDEWLPGIDRDRYLKRDGAGYVARASLRARVDFQRANLLDATAMAAAGPFDVIFCRNVFIYVADECRDRFLASLTGALRVGGYLFMGHSESLLGRHDGGSLRLADQFAYVRT